MIGVLYTIFLILLAGAAIHDTRERLIPNRYPAAIVLLFVPAAVVGAVEPWPAHLLVFAIAFGVCLPLFAFGILGGGDAKLLPAAALWAGPQLLAMFLLATAVAGGVIAFAMIARRRLRRATPDMADDVRAETVPYGVAIAVGGVPIALQSLVNQFSLNSTVLSASGV